MLMVEVIGVRTLTDSVDIDSSPDRVWTWLQNLADHYLDWHPDHVSAEWVVGEPNEVGSVLEVVEDLGGHRERLRLEVRAVCPPRLVQYRIRGVHSLLLARGTFEVHSREGGSTFTASIWFRGGGFVERLFRRQIIALREHMSEEGQSLQRLLAGST